MSKTKIVGVVRDTNVVKAGMLYPVGTLILSNGTASLPTGKIVKIATGEVLQTQESWTPNLAGMVSIPSWK